MTHQMYYGVLYGQWNGLANSVFNLTSDTIKVSAHTNTYAIDLDVQEFWNDTTDEVTGGNYIAGGATLTGVQVTMNAGTVTFDVADVIWRRHAAGFSARKFVFYRSTGAVSTSRLFSVVTADADLNNIASDLVLSGA